MKKLHKIFSFILVGILSIMLATNVNALENTINIGISSDITPYVADVHVAKIPLVGGGYAYCIESAKITPSKMVARLSKEADPGIAYILENGYPRKSITGNNDYDYYITQTAIWWYLDAINGTSNLPLAFKTDGKDEFNLRGHIKNLVDNARAYKNNYKASLVLSPKSQGLEPSADKKYFETVVDVKTTNLTGTYKVSTNSDKLVITDLNNNAKNTFNITESFKIRVVNGKYDPSKLKVTVSAIHKYSKAYEYASNNSAIQGVVILSGVEEEISSFMELSMQPTCDNGGIVDGCNSEEVVEVVEVTEIPDTSTNTMFYVIGFIILMSSTLYVVYNAKIRK